jgi:hypothetical protein
MNGQKPICFLTVDINRDNRRRTTQHLLTPAERKPQHFKSSVFKKLEFAKTGSRQARGNAEREN